MNEFILIVAMVLIGTGLFFVYSCSATPYASVSQPAPGQLPSPNPSSSPTGGHGCCP